MTSYINDFLFLELIFMYLILNFRNFAQFGEIETLNLSD